MEHYWSNLLYTKLKGLCHEHEGCVFIKPETWIAFLIIKSIPWSRGRKVPAVVLGKVVRIPLMKHVAKHFKPKQFFVESAPHFLEERAERIKLHHGKLIVFQLEPAASLTISADLWDCVHEGSRVLANNSRNLV